MEAYPRTNRILPCILTILLTLLTVVTSPAIAQTTQPLPKRVVFVCDMSGSMKKHPNMPDELAKHLGELDVSQLFCVVVYQNKAVASGPMLAATAKNLQAALDFVTDRKYENSSNALEGLKTAFNLNPQLIRLLTDGLYDPPFNPSSKTLLAYVKKRNPAKAVRIDTVLFVSETEKLRSIAGTTCQQLASDNRGVCVQR